VVFSPGGRPTGNGRFVDDRVHGIDRQYSTANDGMSCSMDMHGMSWMMGGMGLVGLLLLVLLVLGVAALVKYLRQ
jgi:hypothetical protein